MNRRRLKLFYLSFCSHFDEEKAVALTEKINKWAEENNVIIEKYEPVSLAENKHVVYVTYVDNGKRELMTEKED